MSASAAKATETRTILPPIPAKRYFTIGEVSELCGVKPHVLRYWEQEFTQLRPMKRRGNRRYYQHHEVLLIRRIRELLYEHGFTISGARNRLAETAQPGRKKEAELTQPVDITLSLRQSDVEAIRQDLMVALDLLRDAPTCSGRSPFSFLSRLSGLPEAVGLKAFMQAFPNARSPCQGFNGGWLPLPPGRCAGPCSDGPSSSGRSSGAATDSACHSAR